MKELSLKIKSVVYYTIDDLMITRDKFSILDIVSLVQAECGGTEDLIRLYVRSKMSVLIKENKIIYCKSGNFVSYIVMK